MEPTASSSAVPGSKAAALPRPSAVAPASDATDLCSRATRSATPIPAAITRVAASPRPEVPGTGQQGTRPPADSAADEEASVEVIQDEYDTQSTQPSFQLGDDSSSVGHGVAGPAASEPVADAASSRLSTVQAVDSDSDSALGDDDQQSSTQSVRSSIYNFVVENGRTFHRYKQGKYLMPNDKSEQERLDLQHNIFLLLLKGKLHRAPIQDPQRVLDLGTGTGIWAIEFDLSPIQPLFVPPNCHFEIDDAEDDWSYGSKPFDFVHLRLLGHSFTDIKGVLRSAYDNLRPGGYIEWQDFMSRFRAVDSSLEGTALDRLAVLYAEGGKNLGRDMVVTPKIAGMMRDVGFVNVVEERYALPGNPWPKGPEAKMLGLWQMTNFLEGMQAITMTVLTRGLGMTPTEVEMLLMEVRKDVKNTNVHFYTPVYIMYGRKPFPNEAG